jgi:predicted permease
MGSFVQDIRYGLQQLRKSRGFTTIAVITLALGIGANTAIFSVLNGWLLRPLPVRAPEQIVVLAAQHKEGGDTKFSYLDFRDFQQQADSFSDVFAYGLGAVGLSNNGKAMEFSYSDVTGNYFSALGVRPALGRFFVPGEGENPGDPVRVVLGYSCWQNKFGGDRSLLGRQVLVNGKSAEVIGVAGKDFHGSLFAFDMDGYLTLSSRSGDATGMWTDRNNRGLTLMGRLKPGTSAAQAQSSISVIAERLTAQFPTTHKGVSVVVIPERMARPAPLVASFVPIIAGLFLGLAAFLLLLACMNVANVWMVRATARQQEMAIRAALGAGRRRLLQQMLTEGLLRAIAGGAAGVVLGEWIIAASGALLHPITTSSSNFAYRLDCSLDWRVFAYTLGAVLGTGIVVGMWPALRAGRANVSKVLHERSGSAVGRHKVRSILVVAQVAGSLTLLIVAGLFVRSLFGAEHMYLGFDPHHVLNVMMDPQQIGYDETRTKAFYRDLEQRVRAMPGVRSASLAYSVPLGFPSPAEPIHVEHHPLAAGEQAPEIPFNSIEPAYLDTMQTPVLRGRNFSESDNETAPPVAIVNQAMAKKFWMNEDPIGKRFSLKTPGGPLLEIVGLVPDGQTMWHLSPESQPYFYRPVAQNYSSFRSLQVASWAQPESLIAAVQDQIHEVAPDLPIIDIRTMEQTVHGLGGLFVFRLAASLAGAMGILGLVLAVVGVYGVTSYAISLRTHEIGVRMALGADRNEILNLVSRRGLALVLAGVVLGLGTAAAFTRTMQKLLIGVSSTDPVTYVSLAVLLSGVALFACWMPARRATKVDPMVALRYE